MEVLVQYDYNAQNDDELTIKKGDKIRNAYKKEDGWMEGELSGKKGLFPDNFVQIIKTAKSAALTNPNETKKKNLFTEISNKFSNNSNNSNNINEKKSQMIINSQQIPQSLSPQLQPPQTQPKPLKTSSDIFKARVLYTYTPMNEDELEIHENEIVDVIRLVEDGWYEGLCNGKQGVFPSNYVAKLDSNSPRTNDKVLTSSDDLEVDERKNRKPTGGVGFGNIFSGKPIELKTKDQRQQPNDLNSLINTNGKHQLPTPPTIAPPPISNINKINTTLRNNKDNNVIIVKARVIYNYEPTQPDELHLRVGDIINILDKNLDDEGWWKGEFNGKIGVFPDNFVEEVIEKKFIINNNNGHNNNKENTTIINPSSPPPPSLLQQQKPHQLSSQQHNQKSQPQSSSSSSSSLVASPYINNTNTNNNNIQNTSNNLINNDNLNNTKDDAKQMTLIKKEQQLNSNTNLLSKSLDSNDEQNMKIDDLNNSAKLIHMKKVKQPNKRPPSFRLKNRGEKIEDAESLSAQTANTNLNENAVVNNESNSTNSSQEHLAKSSPVHLEKKHADVDNFENKFQPSVLTPSPPPYTSSLNNYDDGQGVKNDFEFLKRTVLQLQNELRNQKHTNDDQMQKMQNELRTQKQTYEDQMQKLQKKVKDLVDEIDEEKKTRLALHVEIERLKKIMSNH